MIVKVMVFFGLKNGILEYWNSGRVDPVILV